MKFKFNNNTFSKINEENEQKSNQIVYSDSKDLAFNYLIFINNN